MADQKPSVGRIVHYVAYGTPGGEFPAGVCRAAVITEVYDVQLFGDLRRAIPDYPTGGVFTFGADGWCTDVGLCVLNPTGLFFNRGILYDEEKKPGSWHWPERV